MDGYSFGYYSSEESADDEDFSHLSFDELILLSLGNSIAVSASKPLDTQPQAVDGPSSAGTSEGKVGGTLYENFDCPHEKDTAKKNGRTISSLHGRHDIAATSGDEYKVNPINTNEKIKPISSYSSEPIKKRLSKSVTFDDSSKNEPLQSGFSSKLSAETPMSASTTSEATVSLLPTPMKEVSDPKYRKSVPAISSSKRAAVVKEEFDILNFTSPEVETVTGSANAEEPQQETDQQHMDLQSDESKSVTPIRRTGRKDLEEYLAKHLATGTKKRANKSSKIITPLFIFFCVFFALSLLTNIIFMTTFVLRENGFRRAGQIDIRVLLEPSEARSDEESRGSESDSNKRCSADLTKTDSQKSTHKTQFDSDLNSNPHNANQPIPIPQCQL